MVTYLQVFHARANCFHNTATLMAQNRRKQALRVGTRKSVGIGMAHTGGDNLHQHFALLRRRHIHFHNFQWLVSLKRYSRAGFNHFQSPGIRLSRIACQH
jgi:hypothetical protein